jgi:hypothetical protein
MDLPLLNYMPREELLQELERRRDRREAVGHQPLCEGKTEFFNRCGHIVYSKTCRSESRVWRDGVYHDPTGCCDETCVTRWLPPMANLREYCLWCVSYNGFPDTNSIRSEPDDPRRRQIDRLEHERRRNQYIPMNYHTDQGRWRWIEEGEALLLYYWKAFQDMRRHEFLDGPRDEELRPYFLNPYHDESFSFKYRI